jgi:hypothetical protein
VLYLSQADGEPMQAQMKAVMLPPASPTHETYEKMLARREQLETAIRRYFEENGIAARWPFRRRGYLRRRSEKRPRSISLARRYLWPPR